MGMDVKEFMIDCAREW